MSLLLVRHASAGDPSEWEGDDRERPLDERGRRQAEGLVEALDGFELDRIVSSPYLRCVQTVEPLARARGLEIDLDDACGAHRLEEVPQALNRLRGQNAAVCTHGDLPFLGDRKYKKGSVWVLDSDLRPARYIRPPV
jgi:phosphohistidine phosphatase SixA